MYSLGMRVRLDAPLGRTGMRATIVVPRCSPSVTYKVRHTVVAAAVSEAKKAVTKKKAPKDASLPEKPKKSASAWIIFVKEEIEKHKATLPEGNKVRVADYLAKLGQQWKGMSDAAKKPYNDKAAALKKQHDADMVAYTAKLPPKVQKPTPVYSQFMKEQFPLIQAKNPDVKFLEASTMVAAIWNALPEAEKKHRADVYHAAMDEFYAKNPELKPAEKPAAKPKAEPAAPPAPTPKPKAEPAAAAPPAAAPKAAAKPAPAAPKAAPKVPAPAPKSAAARPKTGKA